jgi:hypothetical protein
MAAPILPGFAAKLSTLVRQANMMQTMMDDPFAACSHGHER